MLTKFAAFGVIDAVQVPSGANAKTLRKAAHRVGFEYEPRPGYLYVRSRAISSRCNDNFDEFPASEIKTAYKTFIGKPVFVNHHNDNHRRARGVIIAAALHEDTNPDGSPDTWTEVLMEVDAVRFPKLAKAILAGHIDRTSMGTDVAFSVCSVCNNKATTPLEYCPHIPRMKGQRIYRTTASGAKEGVLVREICYGLKFFENSLLVEEPADPTAYFLGVEAGPGVVGPKATKIAERDVTDPERYLDRKPDLGHVAPSENYENPEWLEDEAFEHDKNSDIQLTPGKHHTRKWDMFDSTIHSVNSVHAFMKKSSWVGEPCQECGGPKEDRLDGAYSPICRHCWEQEAYQHGVSMGGDSRYDNYDLSGISPGVREHVQRGMDDARALAKNPTGPSRYSSKQADLKPISDCKSCGKKKGDHCEDGCVGTRLYRQASVQKVANNYPLECYGCGEYDHTGNKFFQHGGRGRKCPSCGSEQVHAPEAAENMKPKRPAESDQRRTLATDLVGMHLDNDYDSYHDVQSIVNNSRHPLETAQHIKRYVKGLPDNHPMNVDLRNHGLTHDDADYDDYAQAQHDERDLNPGPIHRRTEDYDKLREAMKRMAQGETVAPQDVNTLRDEECPVCAEKDSYDGNECEVCGFIQPPKMFQDPNLDMAKQIDLRKDQIGGSDPRDPNSDDQGDGQVPQQPSDAPGAVDAQGMPNEVPGSEVPGTDVVPLDQNGPQQPGQPTQPGLPPMPMDPSMLDHEGNPLPSAMPAGSGQIPPVGLPYEGPETGGPALPMPTGPNGLPLAADPNQMGQYDVNQMGQQPGMPIMDGTDPAVQQQFGQPSVAPMGQPAPPGVQGDVMPTEDIYGQPLGPDGPVDPETVQQLQQQEQGLLTPDDIGNGEFAPDGQPYDTAQEGDQTTMLVCDNCGAEFDSAPPTTITTDQPMGSPDGTVEGDVCPDCGQGLLVAETEGMDDAQFGAGLAETEEPDAQVEADSEDKEDTSGGGPPSGGDAGGDTGEDDSEDEESKNPFGGRK